MQVAVSLRNVSNLAYRVKNLQVTAFIQDPLDHTRLTPVATLLPDSEPAEGFTLGPLVADRGPIIFSNSTIVPTLVESLMANSSGLIFRISNYDIINEDGRNFAFVNQDVVERTSQVVIDFGGASSLVAKVSGVPSTRTSRETRPRSTASPRAPAGSSIPTATARSTRPRIVKPRPSSFLPSFRPRFSPSPGSLMPMRTVARRRTVGATEISRSGGHSALQIDGNTWAAYNFPSRSPRTRSWTLI